MKRVQSKYVVGYMQRDQNSLMGFNSNFPIHPANWEKYRPFMLKEQIRLVQTLLVIKKKKNYPIQEF